MGFNASQKGLKLILAIAIPAIVTNLTTPLLGLCDIAIAGHRGGASFIAALAVGSSMFNMAYWLFGFLRMGSSGLTARAYGAANRSLINVLLLRALILGLLSGMIIVAFRIPLCELLLKIMDVPDEAAYMARRYFMIVVWGAPAVLATYSLTGWLLGMQNSRLPMLVSIVADVVNVIVSVTLVFGIGMEIEGVATGTITAQWLSFLLAVILCIRYYHPHIPELSEIFEANGLRQFFKVNTDIFLRTLCLVAVTMWFTRVGAMQGEMMLAVNALLMQLFTLFSYFMDGFAFSAEALAGRHYGAGDYRGLRKIIRLELECSTSVAILFSALYFFGGEWILSILTTDISVIRASSDYLVWAMLFPAAGFMAFCFDGIAIGVSATRMMLVSILLAALLFFTGYAFLFPIMGNHGLWLAFLLYLAVRGFGLWLLVRHHISRVRP